MLVVLEPAVWQASARVHGPCGEAVAAAGEAAPQAGEHALRQLGEVVDSHRAVIGPLLGGSAPEVIADAKR